MDSLIHMLERGKESCNQMINIFEKLQSSSSLSFDPNLYDDHQGNYISYLKEIGGHCKVVQTTLDDALFVLKSYDFIEDVMHMNKTKVRRTDTNDSPSHYCEIENKFGGEIPKHANSKNRRGSYKRRRNEHEKIIETWNLTDDGHAWRKYGQKVILNATHPRNYYRCTHKHEEGCQATKQVQQISENPPKHKIIYHGQHTCKAATSKSNPTILFDPNDDTQNSILVSFDTGKQALNYPFMFPPTPPCSSISSSSSGVAMLPRSSIKEELIASEPSLNGTHNNQYTSTSPYHQCVAPSPVGTAVSDNILADVISSTTELYSVSSVNGMDADECYSNILADDFINLDYIYNNQPNLFTLTKLMTTF